MKRTIACEGCSQRPAPHYPGEWFKRVSGVAKQYMLCDYCPQHKLIVTGDKCAAESYGVDGVGIQYYPWESEYITEVKP